MCDLMDGDEEELRCVDDELWWFACLLLVQVLLRFDSRDTTLWYVLLRLVELRTREGWTRLQAWTS